MTLTRIILSTMIFCLGCFIGHFYTPDKPKVISRDFGKKVGIAYMDGYEKIGRQCYHSWSNKDYKFTEVPEYPDDCTTCKLYNKETWGVDK